MADFLENFKRRESQSSEGSLGEDDDYEPQFAQEEIRHHSDEEDNKRPANTNSRSTNAKSYQHEEKKQIRVNENRKNGSSPNKNQQKKDDYYLYQGEERPYESDPEDQNQGQKQPRKDDPKNEKKLDPTFVPKGTFYQHDTRGDEVEYVPKKNSDKHKSKWKHDKFEKGYNQKSNKDNNEGNTYYDKRGSQVVYVVKGEKQPEGEQPPKQKQNQPQSQSSQRPRNQEQKQYSKKQNYEKGDRGYGNKQQQHVEYVKKDANKKQPAEGQVPSNPKGHREYYVEYVAKKPETK